MPCPNRDTGVFEASVYQVSALSEVEMWEIGKGVVIKSSKTLYGCAVISAGHIKEAGLSVLQDNNPPRHANIVGWPDEKSEQKPLALRLAGSARLKLLS